MPIPAKQDHTILGEKATGNTTAPTSARGRERSDTPSSDANVTGDRTDDQDVAEPGKEVDEQDPAMRQILAYLAAHPQAKQAEVADALGMAVRTMQRKLAAWKRQQPGASHE
jgi:DNA-binding NtrC family response regulator